MSKELTLAVAIKKERQRTKHAKGVTWVEDEKIIIEKCVDKDWTFIESRLGKFQGFQNFATGKKYIISNESCTDAFAAFKIKKSGKKQPEKIKELAKKKRETRDREKVEKKKALALKHQQRLERGKAAVAKKAKEKEERREAHKAMLEETKKKKEKQEELVKKLQLERTP